MSGHARLSPSSAKRWSVCTAAPGAEDGLPNKGNDASRWGTACHLLSSTCLETGEDPSAYLGQSVHFIEKAKEERVDEVIVGLFT